MVVIRWKDIFERIEDAIDSASAPACWAEIVIERTCGVGRRQRPDRRRWAAGPIISLC